jgi:Cu(I)/Ag(I) efflux system protein CusF
MKALKPLIAAALLATGIAHAQTTDSMPMPMKGQASAPAAAAKMTDSEVRKVDKDGGKVTLRHGPIENLGMPGMTMAFKVSDPKMLDAIKEGDKVRFTAERVGGAIAVTRIETAK